jgi:hypothetical protein
MGALKWDEVCRTYGCGMLLFCFMIYAECLHFSVVGVCAHSRCAVSQTVLHATAPKSRSERPDLTAELSLRFHEYFQLQRPFRGHFLRLKETATGRLFVDFNSTVHIFHFRSSRFWTTIFLATYARPFRTRVTTGHSYRNGSSYHGT